MGVRPPSNGDSTPETIEFGIAAVDARLDTADLTFPASKADVESELGDEQIPYDVHGNTVELADILTDVDVEQFESSVELLNELHPHFETYRKQHSRSVVGQVRSLLPF